jgi:hypothetical protein
MIISSPFSAIEMASLIVVTSQDAQTSICLAHKEVTKINAIKRR